MPAPKVFLNSYWEEDEAGNIATLMKAFSAYCQSLQSDPCLIHTSKQSEGIKVTMCVPGTNTKMASRLRL